MMWMMNFCEYVEEIFEEVEEQKIQRSVFFHLNKIRR